VFIILSQIPFIAENYIDTSEMDETTESYLRFSSDGKTGHYYVERYDTNVPGRIHVVYTTKSNSLEVECTNIKVLKIYCREMYEKKSEEVFKIDPELDSNYYKTYFITRDYFSVHVYTEDPIKELSFMDTPIPYNTTVNGQEWWLSEINYTYNNDGIVLTKVPPGHSYVDIYFQSNDLKAPLAKFKVSETIAGIGQSIRFNATASTDPDGEIISYVWDFGDGGYKGNVITNHAYTEEGTYNVILTVTDDDYLINRAYQKIIVVQKAMSISKSVDKPIATPGTTITYTISPVINSSWTEGVKDIVVKDVLPPELDYVSASPLPQMDNRTVLWKLGIAFVTSELPKITLQTMIDESVADNTYIKNNATVEYFGITDQTFPAELSNTVTTKVNVDTILAPTIKLRVPDIELMEDDPPFNLYLNSYEFDYQDFGTDLNWYISEANDTLYTVSGEYSEDDILTITPQPNAFGNSLVTLWLVDSEGFTAYQPIWINITPVNDNPIFSSAPSLAIHYDTPYIFDYEPYLYDIDTPKEELQLLVSENTDIKTREGTEENIVINGFKVTYTYPESFVDDEVLVTLLVFDGTGSDDDTIQIKITDDYTPTLLKDLPDVWLVEGESKNNVFDIDDYFVDPDGDSLFYSFGETHVTVNINTDNTVDISSPSDWNGVDSVTFRARDPKGALAEDTITVTVTPINDPPVFEGVPEYFYVHYDADYSFDLTPYITDEDHELIELFLILSDEHIRTDPINHLKIIMNYPQSMVGMQIPVKLIVSDNFQTAEQNVIVEVTDNWPPYITQNIPDISFYEDEVLNAAIDLNDYFSDLDSETLFYSYGQQNVKIEINVDGTVDFSSEANWNGIEIVTFRATDITNAFVECVIHVSVIPVNDPPEILTLPFYSGFVNHLLKFNISDYLVDIDNNISELEINVDTSGLDISVSGGKLFVYSNRPMVENVTIIVSDGLNETSGFMWFDIKAESRRPDSSSNDILANLWILIIIILVMLSIAGFTGYRKYVGNYKIEEIFCIYDNGTLISHLSTKKSSHAADEYVVSGMLTAIINFTQDAFTEEEKNKKAWGIKEIQMMEKNILIDRGEHIILATVFSGTSGKRLYSLSRRTMGTIEDKYQNEFDVWTGNLKSFEGVKTILNNSMPIDSDDKTKNN
jgi:uncharacterized repeat protein (TIGR01451 family)